MAVIATEMVTVTTMRGPNAAQKGCDNEGLTMTDDHYQRRAAFYATLTPAERLALETRATKRITKSVLTARRSPESFDELQATIKERVQDEIELAYQDHLALFFGAVRMEDDA